jgi:hypothetical protein
MTRNTPLTHVTECGISGIGVIPFGVHLCHFYPGREELVDGLVPYFATGLSRNESCLWITAPPLPAKEARTELMQVVPGLEFMIAAGQIRFVEAADWHAGSKGMDGNDLIQSWLREEENALADGYQGLRIAGNAGFLGPEDWDAFADYESAVNSALRGRRIVVLCSYDIQRCRATDVLDVVIHHQHTLDRRDAKWEVVPGANPFA